MTICTPDIMSIITVLMLTMNEVVKTIQQSYIPYKFCYFVQLDFLGDGNMEFPEVRKVKE